MIPLLYPGLVLMLCLSMLRMGALASSSLVSQVHKDAKEKAIIGILTNLKELERRLTIRSTYTRQMHSFTDIHFRFVLGVPAKFEEAGKNMALQTEAHLFHDMLLLEHTDPKLEHARKTHLLVLSFFAWALKQTTHYDFVMKVNIDTYVHPFNLQRLLATLPRQQIYWGKEVRGDYVFSLPEGDVEIKSLYMSGEGYMLSRDLVSFMIDYQEECKEAASILLDSSKEEDMVVGLWVSLGMKYMKNIDEGREESALLRRMSRRSMQEEEKERGQEEEQEPEQEQEDEEGGLFNPSEVLPMHEKNLTSAPLKQWAGYDKDDIAPLSAILVHDLQEAGRLPSVHLHFAANSYFEWHACAQLNYEPELCTALWQAKDHLEGWPEGFSQFYAALSKLPKKHKKKGVSRISNGSKVIPKRKAERGEEGGRER